MLMGWLPDMQSNHSMARSLPTGEFVTDIVTTLRLYTVTTHDPWRLSIRPDMLCITQQCHLDTPS